MKQELIEQTTVDKTVKPGGVQKKNLLLIALGVLLVGGVGIGLTEVVEDYWDDRNEQTYQTLKSSPVANKETQQSSTLATQKKSADVVTSSELDGTYSATVSDETYTLTIKGTQGNLQTNEADGDQEVEQIVFDLEKKVAYVDGDAETYTFDGKTLVLTEVENDLFDKDQITFTKQ